MKASETKNQKTEEHKKKKSNPQEEIFGHNVSPKTLFFFGSFVFWCSSRFFVFFFSPVADESFRAQKPKNSKKTKKNPLEEICRRKIYQDIFVFFEFLCFFFRPVADESYRV